MDAGKVYVCNSQLSQVRKCAPANGCELQIWMFANNRKAFFKALMNVLRWVGD